jgi:hypothetical protein
MSDPGASPARRPASAPRPSGVLSGQDEAIFRILSEEVVRNMRAGSESAAVWNAFYPFADRGIDAQAWFGLPRLWGSEILEVEADVLIPYFWGIRSDGSPMPGLADVIEAIAGRDDRLEVDLFLRGDRSLVAVEAKLGSGPGRCGRYESGRCPEIHVASDPCRYWVDGPAEFSALLEFGARPQPGEEPRPPCSVHYQLARTLLLTQRMAASWGLAAHLCLLVPRPRWASLQATWLDFVERIRDDGLWQNLRVIAWQDLGTLGSGTSSRR